MKRFWNEVTVADGAILLDHRPVRTPARRPLAPPTAALAAAIAEEWRAQGDEVDPRAMPLTGLANAAIDRVAPDPPRFAAGLAAYAGTDLLCYRAEGPDSLVGRQAAMWDPPLGWAGSRYGARFAVTAGIVHVAQPPETIARLGAALAARDAFALAGLSPLVTVSGSLVLALALADGAMDERAAWDAATCDEAWQAARWGDDPLAAAARDERRGDFSAGARFLALLGRDG